MRLFFFGLPTAGLIAFARHDRAAVTRTASLSAARTAGLSACARALVLAGVIVTNNMRDYREFC